MNRRTRRRRLGLGLLAFGLSGLALILAAGALIFATLSAVDDAATSFEAQRIEILAMLGPASSSLSNAAASATNAGASLTASSEAAGRAAALTTRLAESFEGLASLGTFQLLGTRPFAGLATQFAAVGAEARALSADLTATSAAIATNVADSQAVAANLSALAEQLDTLEERLRATSGGGLGEAGSAVTLARIVLLGLLAWLAIPAIVSTWLGWRLTRTAA